MANSNESPRLLTVPEVANILQLTPEYVRQMLRKGTLPGLLIGTVWRVDAQKLAQWIDEQQRN